MTWGCSHEDPDHLCPGVAVDAQSNSLVRSWPGQSCVSRCVLQGLTRGGNDSALFSNRSAQIEKHHFEILFLFRTKIHKRVRSSESVGSYFQRVQFKPSQAAEQAMTLVVVQRDACFSFSTKQGFSFVTSSCCFYDKVWVFDLSQGLELLWTGSETEPTLATP